MKRVVSALCALAICSIATPAHATGVVVTLNSTIALDCDESTCRVVELAGTMSAPAGGAPSGAVSLGTGGVETSDPTCEAGTASGEISIGAQSFSLSWVRVGATALTTLSGSLQTGVLVLVFVGNPDEVIARCQGTPGIYRYSLVGGGAFP